MHVLQLEEEMTVIGLGLERVGRATQRVKRRLHELEQEAPQCSLPAGSSGRQRTQEAAQSSTTVAAHLYKHRHALMAHWRRFNEAGEGERASLRVRVRPRLCACWYAGWSGHACVLWASWALWAVLRMPGCMAGGRAGVSHASLGRRS